MKKAFTLVEQAIVIVIVGLLATVLVASIRPNEIKEEALKKAGLNFYVQIETAFKKILAQNTNNFTLERMIDSSGEFSIAKTDSTNRLIEILKTKLISIRNSSLDSTYSTMILTDGTTSITDTSPSNFTGFKLKNGGFLGIKLYGDCTTDINYLYDPTTPEKKDKTDICGIVFFDVNSQKEPNRLGIDQYIVGIGKRGLK